MAQKGQLASPGGGAGAVATPTAATSATTSASK
jgi:hypothetical protein